MKNKVEVRYFEDQDLYRADFYKGKKLIQSKALTNDELDALSEVSTPPRVGELVTLNANFLTEELERIGSIDFDSNLMIILQELAR